MTEQDKQALIKHFCSRDCGEAAKDCTIMPCHEIELIQEFPTTEPDTDTISRQAAIDLLKQMRKDGDMIPWEGKDVFARIRKLPPAQPEIIRCKDCKNYKFGMCLYSMTSGVGKLPNGFCDWAERSEVTT